MNSPTMNRICRSTFVAVVASTIALVSCSKPPPPPAPQPSTPPPTPHPAKAAKEAAVRMYPDLSVADSQMHTAFREIYEERLARRPASLTRVDWPLEVARQAAGMLGVDPVDKNQPPPPPAPAPIVVTSVPATPAPTPVPKPPNPLEKGAYNRSKSFQEPFRIDR